MEEQKEKKQGHKVKGQKYKSLLVWDILQKRTDENHAIQLKEIVEHLKMYGITAERHSIKRDIPVSICQSAKGIVHRHAERMLSQRRSKILI